MRKREAIQLRKSYRVEAKRQAAKEWLRMRLTKPVAETMKLLASIIRGHCNYYGVNGNFHGIQNFWKYLKFLRIWNYYIPSC